MSMYSNRLQPALQNLLQRVVWFFHQRSSCTTTHISADVQRITLNVSCMTISGERTEKLDIFCRVTWLYEWFSHFRRCGTYSVLSRSPSIITEFLVVFSRFWCTSAPLCIPSGGQCVGTHCLRLPANVTATLTLSPPIRRMDSAIRDERRGVCVGGRGTGRRECGWARLPPVPARLSPTMLPPCAAATHGGLSVAVTWHGLHHSKRPRCGVVFTGEENGRLSAWPDTLLFTGIGIACEYNGSIGRYRYPLVSPDTRYPIPVSSEQWTLWTLFVL